MSKFLAALLLLVIPAVCGFNWGIRHDDPCLQAKKLLQDQPALKDQEIPKKEEDRIIQLCPDGAAARYLKALRLERSGKLKEAMAEYREAVKAEEDAPAEAHGNLGLLLAQEGLTDQASVELTRGLLGKRDPRYHLALAGILAAAKVYPLALYHFQEAAKAFPADAAIQESLAGCYQNTGQPEKAEAAYRKALQLQPGRLSTQLALAGFYRSSNRLPEAITVLGKASKSDPRNKEIHRVLADTFRENGETARARAEYKLAGMDVSIDPEDFLRKGDEYMAAKSYEKAATAYGVALKGKPGWREAQQKLGEAEMAAGHDDAAIGAFQQAVKMTPLDIETIYNLGVLYERKGMLDDAIGAYQQTLQKEPGNGDALRRLADIYYLRGNFQLAIKQYKELIRLRGENPLLHLKLSKAYEKSRDYKSAMNEYQRALQIDPENLQAHKELAALYRQRGRADAAITEYGEVLRLSRSDSEARAALTALFVKEKRYGELLGLLKDGATIAPDDPNSHYKLGLVYEFQKDYPSAISEYQRAVELQANHAKGLNALGRLYLRTGRLDQAKQLLESAKKADPTFAEPQMLLANIQADLAAHDASDKSQLRHSNKGKHRKKDVRPKKKQRKRKAR